jgi:murein DD-endopeptidase MepM/ murein hydrolase activator NlpD
MDDERTRLQRYGGHLALLIVAGLLFIAARSVPLSDLLDFDMNAGSAAAESPENEHLELLSYDDNQEQRYQSVNMDAVPLLVNYNLSPRLNPITFQGKLPSHDTITYTVQSLDTPIGISDQFGISPETILGGNPRLSEEASALQTGTVLTILPVDGVLHDVQPGESLERIANLYGVTPEDIINYAPNNLEFPFRLYGGTQIMVPGGVREVFIWSAPAPKPRTSGSGSAASNVELVATGTGTFIWPVANRRITQHYWYGHPAIDIGSPEGMTVVASDTGTVTWAGWNIYGYGNLVVINHGNGYETYYGHLSQVNVQVGQPVYQGSAIGASGNTGRSSGPHLHFEVRYFNSLYEPLAYLR